MSDKLTADEALAEMDRFSYEGLPTCFDEENTGRWHAAISSELAALRERVKELEAKRFHTGEQIMREFDCPPSPVAHPPHDPYKSKP